MERVRIQFVRVLYCLFVASAGLEAHAADEVYFRERVAPILERNCVSCHEGSQPKGGLSLATGELALAGGDGGECIVPGKPDESTILDYISGDEPEMPKDARPLSPDEVAAIREWIAGGAPWPKGLELVDKKKNDTNWWSLQPLKRPEVPEISTPPGFEIRNPVDAFILARLIDHQLTPSPQADRRTLARRLYFDLTGLLPTPEQVDDFVADPDPQAYEKLVDELLASTAYGERWGRHWLDVVHYGDTHGYDKDQPRPNAWPYRDYVIRSFNEDKPYSQFVKEQLAGDMLYPDTRNGVEGLGFISAGPWDFIGHVEVSEDKIDGKIARSLDRDDMVASAMNTFNSLTVQCARCHNHKFDPVTQEDYYSLQAVFSALDRADRKYDIDPAVAGQRRVLTEKKQQLVTASEQLQKSILKLAGGKLAELDKKIALLERPKAGPNAGAAFFGYHSDIVPKPDVVKWVQVDLGKSIPLGRIVLHAASDNFAGIGDGFGFPLRFKVEVSDDAEFKSGVTLIADHTRQDFANPRLAPVSLPVNGQPARYVRVTATRLALRQNDYIMALAELVAIDTGGTVVSPGATVTALDSIEVAPRWGKSNLVDRFFPGSNLSGSPELLEQLRQERARLIESTVDAATRARLDATLAELEAVEQDITALPPQHVMYAGTIHHGTGAFRGTGYAGGKPRVVHVLHRGDVRTPRQEVGPGTVDIVPGVPSRFKLTEDASEGARRVALARWITDPRNPLTWRSIVNRVWLYHFGRGIVDSPNDFGRMGQLPSHPLLLDWLAVEFRDGGQSIKSLHRLICNSSTYRQSSATHEKYAEVDGGNVYLWRMNRRRMEAEAIRDAVLQVAGKLNLLAGGPGFRDFVIEHPAHSPHYEYKLFDAENPVCHRRSVYRFIVRSQPQPFMATLDCADPSMSVDKRNQSMTALQALALLNNKLMVAMSRHFADRLQKEAADVPGQVRRGFRLAVLREPTSEEQQALVEYAQQYGLANACRVILNLNEFAFVD